MLAAQGQLEPFRQLPVPAGPRVDVAVDAVASELVGFHISTKLAAQGFCVLSPGFEAGLIDDAIEEIREFDTLGRWRQVNDVVQQGLLGSEGSSEIAELDPPDLEDEARQDGKQLLALDSYITDLGFRVEPFTSRLGFAMSHRTAALVHMAGEPHETPMPLNEKECTKWLQQFLKHKLMVCIFLGPTPGILELKPYTEVDTEVHEITTSPGLVVLLRPDLMSHMYFSPGDSYVVSSFFLTGQLTKSLETWELIPPAKELDDWTLWRLKQLKLESREESMWDPDIPRHWQTAMNHLFHKGQMIGIYGECCQFQSLPPGESSVWYQAMNSGVDYPVQVPITRWHHTDLYDPDLDGWKSYKSYCRHGGFMEGIELFDPRKFSMSPQEAKSIDPHQRLILEVGYLALYNMGKRRNNLLNAHCGVYVGCGNVEWQLTPKDLGDGSGAFGATGGALSISSGRFSFTLGLKGPSMTLDTEASSGATSLYLAAESVQRKGRATPNDFALGIGVHLMLSPINWPAQCASGWLSAQGRSFTFDASASGYVRADGCGAVAVRSLCDFVDGEWKANEDLPVLGAIAGASMHNAGRGATLSAPHGPSEQETIAEAIRNAQVSPFDVDAVEAHGSGSLLGDAVELGSIGRAHRSQDQKESIGVMAAKSAAGNQVEASGIGSFMKVLYSERFGTMPPNLHLRQMNPHSDSLDQHHNLLSEALEYRLTSMFAGVMSRGFGGSNVYLLSWGQLDNQYMATRDTSAPSREAIAFWPGGGGTLTSEQRPSKSYTIVGTWSQWKGPVAMELERDGIYRASVTLGTNRWEMFQIWIDGDPAKVLHPGIPKASKDFPVEGPEAEIFDCHWMIDGRDEMVEAHSGDPEEAPSFLPIGESGLPGDTYHVRLSVAGKWRTVTWEKTRAEIPADAVVEDPGRYFLTGSFNNWALQELEPDATNPGSFRGKVKLLSHGTEFQIVRNEDFNQVLYPNRPGAGSDATIFGPDDLGEGLSWWLDGTRGQEFEVTFVRKVTRAEDAKVVSWSLAQAAGR